MISCKAAVLTKSKQDLEIIDIYFPKQLYFGQVLVKVISTGICGAQINEIDAVKGPDLFLPHLLGHEGFGVVVSTGEGVSKVKVGDEVILHWRKGMGIQSSTPEFRDSIGNKVSAGWVTTFSEFTIVSENRITRINSDGFDKKILPLLGCALSTAVGVLTKETKYFPGKNILITGAGGVGLLLVYLAKQLHFSNIVVIDQFDERLKCAEDIGATKIINSKFVDLNLVTLTIDSPHVAVETTGNPNLIEFSYRNVSSTGTVILVGVPDSNSTISINTLPLHFRKELKGTEGGSIDPTNDIPLLMNAIKSKNFDFSRFPLNTYSLSDINSAIHALRNGIIGRNVILMDES